MHLPIPFQLVQLNYKNKQYFFSFCSKRERVGEGVRKNCLKKTQFLSLKEGCSLSSKNVNIFLFTYCILKKEI